LTAAICRARRSPGDGKGTPGNRAFADAFAAWEKRAEKVARRRYHLEAFRICCRAERKMTRANLDHPLQVVIITLCIEGHCHRTCPDNRPEGDDPLGAVGGDESDAIATGDPSPREATGEACGNVAKLGERLGFFGFAGKSDDGGILAVRRELSP